jgi:hypothetical protein
MFSPIGGSQLAGFCCYEAVVLHNTPAELGRPHILAPHWFRHDLQGNL